MADALVNNNTIMVPENVCTMATDENLGLIAELFKRLTLELQETRGRVNRIEFYLTRSKNENITAIAGVEPPVTINIVDAGAGSGDF
jgi:hypothetical protein